MVELTDPVGGAPRRLLTCFYFQISGAGVPELLGLFFKIMYFNLMF